MNAGVVRAAARHCCYERKLEMKGETWMHAKTPHNPDPSMEERCAFYKWALDQLEAGVPELETAEATGLHAESD